MGRQEGVIQLTGGVGNLSFYKSQDGYLVRKKSGVSRERIMSDRAYTRTRENIAEFGRGAKATKLLRRAFGPLIRTAADNRVTSRLTSTIMKIIKSDAINARGERSVAHGDITLLEGFQFNKNAGLAKTFGAPFTATIDRAGGKMKVTVAAFNPAELISAPQGATHFRLKSVGASIDFKTNGFSTGESESAYFPVGGEQQPSFTLSHTVTPGPSSSLLLVLGIEFAEFVNGVQYPLKDAVGNAMAVVKVEPALKEEVTVGQEYIEERKVVTSRRWDQEIDSFKDALKGTIEGCGRTSLECVKHFYEDRVGFLSD